MGCVKSNTRNTEPNKNAVNTVLSNSYPTGSLPQASSNTVGRSGLCKENTRSTDPNKNTENTVLSNTFPNGASSVNQINIK